MKGLQLNLLGKPEVVLNGAPVTAFVSAKVLALLIYLAVTGQAHSRDTLATLLWGDLPEATAKRNLTKALTNLRQLLEPFLLIERHSVAFNYQTPAAVDVVVFQAAVEGGALLEPDNPERDLAPLRQAVSLYRSEFLAGFYVKNALEFEEWTLGQREYLRGLMLQALQRLTEQSALPGADLAAALEYCRRWLGLEPWQEAAHRQMMLLLARSGQRDAALAQYETCRQILAEELDVAPTPETTILYERLKAAGQPLPHNLPPATIFVGRERSLSHLPAQLGQPDCRLLTLVGPGGIGKTRLAIEIARRCLAPTFGLDETGFADGIYFVNLAPVNAGETLTGGLSEARQVTNLILVTIAEVLDFSFQGVADMKTQLFGHLRQKTMLLVLDNFEHLVEGAGLLVELLNAAPGVRLLVTSRERLNLQEEWVWEINGLAYPGEDWTARTSAGVEMEDATPQGYSVSSLQTYDAVALFCLQAQRIRGDFSLSESEAASVLRLCQLAEGSPLALELAASWLRVLSCAQIVAGVERSLDFLSSSLRNVPERHRSMRAVFEQSWQMLSELEQAAFGRLSLFKGGFQREAAQVIARAGPPILVNLADKSLLRLAPSGRYQLHELLRQFAAEKLLAETEPVETAKRQQPESALVTWQRYSAYYLGLVSQREASLKGGTPQPALSELRADLDNIRQAWQWAVVAAQIEAIEGALGGLARFYDLTGLLEEGAAVFGQAANDLHDHVRPSDEGSKQALQKTIVKLWVEQARLLNRRGLSEQALQIIPEAVELAHQIQEAAVEALAYHQWGETLFFQGQPVLAQAQLEEALRLARAAGQGAIQAEALRHLGLARSDLGDAASALKFYEEALACSGRLKDRRGEALALNNLACVQRGRGEWAEAETHFEQALHIFSEIDYRSGQGTVLNNLSHLHYNLGHYSQAQVLCQQSLQICAEIKDYWDEGHVLNNLGNIMRGQGDFSTAQSHYQQALELWWMIGARFYEGVTLAELALLSHLTGHNEAAYDYGQQAEQIGHKIGSPEIRASALTHLGHAQVALNFLPEAAESYRQALALRQEMGQLHFVREILASLSRTSLTQGNLVQAQAFAAELLPQLEIEHLYGAREPFRVYLSCYLVLQANHDTRAKDVLATAYRLLQERAAEIEDERLRRFYLENIPAHQEIVREFNHPVALPYPVLNVQLLGGFNLIYDDTPITGINSARLQSLLAYLILHADIPQSRQHLAFVLWPDTTETQARNNLRQFFYQLRHALPNSDRFLVADTNMVYWKTDEGQIIDVQRFERTLKDADAAEQQDDTKTLRQMLERALSYYQGDLLPGCYDDWITPEREHWQQHYYTTCQKLTQLLETQREYGSALQVAQHLLRLDPLAEGAYISLIRLHGLNDDRAGARRIYQTAVETFQRELGVEPDDTLRAAYEQSRQLPRTIPRFDPDDSTGSGSLKLIGRQAEWQQLQAAWQRVASDSAHLVLITGEAGIGKSRLAEELFSWAARQGFTTAHTRSYGAEGRLSLAPIIEWLRSSALRPHLAALDRVWLTEIARLLPELLSDFPDLARPEPITEYGRRQRFFEALARGVLAAPRPLLLWIDDLQWCDQETLEWLHFLLRFESRHALLILGTARSEESPPDHPLSALARQLRAEDRIVSIELSPLDAAETAKLAFQVQGQTLDVSASVRLYRETEGNPLFVVETVRAGMAQAVTSPADTLTATTSPNSPNLPPRVHAIIAGRLAQLSPTARKVAEIGAANGRAFTLDLLLQAGHENEDTLIRALDELWQRRIVREQSANLFDFTHDKLRDVAYAETSAPQRRLLHRRIAQALETLNAAELDPISPQVAAHYEQAGLFEQAIPYYQRAGSTAASVYANEEAITLYTRGLELLGQTPMSVKRDAQELNIQLALATLYRISKGWTSPEEERVMNRAMVLSNKVGDIEQRIRTLFGLQTLYVVQARYNKVERTHTQAQELSRQAQLTPPPFAEIYLTGAKLHMGQMVEARELFEKIVAVRDDKHIRDLQESQGLNYLVHGLAWNSHALWCLGYPETALSSAQAAIELAREFVQPFNQALAITYLAMLQAWCANAETFRADAEAAYALSDEYKAPYYRAWASILLRFAQTEQQPDAENLVHVRQAIHTFTETGARIRLPVFFSLLAQACLIAGRWEEGLDALEQALTESLQNDEHWWDAEIHRLRGELMRAQGAAPSEVEAVFQRALEIAQAQQAKSLELRAATSLARLWQANSRPAEAKRLLTQVYAWFAEGFDTPDLQTARALIAQL